MIFCEFHTWKRPKYCKNAKLRAAKMRKIVFFGISKWLKLISRKIWVAEKSWNFHTFVSVTQILREINLDEFECSYKWFYLDRSWSDLEHLPMLDQYLLFSCYQKWFLPKCLLLWDEHWQRDQWKVERFDIWNHILGSNSVGNHLGRKRLGIHLQTHLDDPRNIEEQNLNKNLMIMIGLNVHVIIECWVCRKPQITPPM